MGDAAPGTVAPATPAGVRVLGSLELIDPATGATRELRSVKLRRALATLVVDAGSVVSVDRLADVVWGEEPPANPEASLHSLMSRLRATLREVGDPAVVTTPAS